MLKSDSIDYRQLNIYKYINKDNYTNKRILIGILKRYNINFAQDVWTSQYLKQWIGTEIECLYNS